MKKTSVYAKRKARVFVVYNSLFLNFMCRKKKERRVKEIFFRIHIDIKTSKPTKPANNGILLYSLSSLPTLWDRYVSYPHTRKTDSKG